MSNNIDNLIDNTDNIFCHQKNRPFDVMVTGLLGKQKVFDVVTGYDSEAGLRISVTE